VLTSLENLIEPDSSKFGTNLRRKLFAAHSLSGYPTDMPSVENSGNGDSRLLLVSNRLPITIKRSDDGKYDFSMSSGGLVSGLSGLSKSTTFRWYGWPGLEVPEDEIPVVTKRLDDEYGAFPVFIADELADRHYNGFSS
jgi:trehalose 6-phosphate synthase